MTPSNWREVRDQLSNISGKQRSERFRRLDAARDGACISDQEPRREGDHSQTEDQEADRNGCFCGSPQEFDEEALWKAKLDRAKAEHERENQISGHSQPQGRCSGDFQAAQLLAQASEAGARCEGVHLTRARMTWEHANDKRGLPKFEGK